jgi:PAS domain S-box-containing protein
LTPGPRHARNREEVIRMAEAVRMAEGRTKDMPSLLEQGVSVISADYVVEYQNQELMEKFGDLRGRKCYEGFFGREEPRERCALKRAIEGGISEVCELTSRRGRVYESQFSPFRDACGVGKVIVVTTDITEHKWAEEALKESEKKYRCLINNVKLGVFRSTPGSTGKFLEVNPAMREITGYSQEELLQMNVSDLYVHPGERESILKEMVSTTGKMVREVRLRKKDGTEIVVFDRKAAVRDEAGRVMYFDEIIEDITEHRQAEEKARQAEALEELDRMRTELLANVSHELRTPLATIRGYSTMLLDYDTRLRRDEKRKYLRFIDKASNRLVELVDQLLDMSRLESGLMEMEKVPTSVSSLIREVVAEAQVREPLRRLVLNLPGRLPRLSIDARRIRQVLDNLIDNAIKYSGEDTEVVVSARQVDHELLVSVVDQGMGIPAEELPKVFDRMYRVRQRLSPGTSGAGLGLSICKRLAEAHSGRIWIESEEGRGTTCFFTLPLDAGEDSSGEEA